MTGYFEGGWRDRVEAGEIFDHPAPIPQDGRPPDQTPADQFATADWLAGAADFGGSVVDRLPFWLGGGGQAGCANFQHRAHPF